MKNKVTIISLLVIFLISGCTFKQENTNPTISKEKYYSELEEKLLEYGKLVYNNDYWLYGNITPMIYHMTLNELKTINKVDISMFKKYNSNEMCDKEKTRIEFIVKEQLEENTTNYKYKAVLSCE